MKTIRKGLMLLLVAMFTLAVASFAVACKDKDTVTISFDTNGAGTIASREVKPGELFNLPGNLSLSGFVFEGWHDNPQLTGEALKGTIAAPSVDTTYYAEWLPGYDVFVDFDGGQFEGLTETEFFVGAGKNLFSAVNEDGYTLAEIEPAKSGLMFGDYFFVENGKTTSAVTEATTMPNHTVYLKAKYTVQYTVEIYKQSKPHGTEYDTPEYRNGRSYVDEEYAVVAPSIENYQYYSEHEGNVPSLTLSRTSSENVYKLYYNRETYSVIYKPNVPTGAVSNGQLHDVDASFVYGEKIGANQNSFDVQGYRFAGWSESGSGAVKYKPGDELEDGSRTLFAVWDQGYRDVLGGTDYIFIPAKDPDAMGKILLSRGGLEIVGVRKALGEDGQYTEDASGEYVDFGKELIARLNASNMTFVFFYKNRNTTYTYENTYYGAESSMDATLTLHGYEDGVLVENGVSKKVTYYYDKEAEHYMLSVEGERTARPFVFGAKNDQPVFTYVGEEEGVYIRYSRTSLMSYTMGNNQI